MEVVGGTEGKKNLSCILFKVLITIVYYVTYWVFKLQTETYERMGDEFLLRS